MRTEARHRAANQPTKTPRNSVLSPRDLFQRPSFRLLRHPHKPLFAEPCASDPTNTVLHQEVDAQTVSRSSTVSAITVKLSAMLQPVPIHVIVSDLPLRLSRKSQIFECPRCSPLRQRGFSALALSTVQRAACFAWNDFLFSIPRKQHCYERLRLTLCSFSYALIFSLSIFQDRLSPTRPFTALCSCSFLLVQFSPFQSFFCKNSQLTPSSMTCSHRQVDPTGCFSDLTHGVPN